MKEVGSTQIAAVSFSILMIPSLIVLMITGFFELSFLEAATIRSTAAGMILGIVGTAIASIIFYQLLKRAGIIFSSLVTYGIPFVALMWGVLAGENITLIQIAGLAVILVAVYIANR